MNVPIAQAAKIVIGEIMGANYIVDPKLDGKITLHTARPTRKSAIVEMFEAALRGANAAIVKSGDAYKIVPVDQAPFSGEPIRVSGPGGGATGIGDGVEIVQLRYVSASEMKRVLEPMVPKGAILRADDARNLITISGTQQDVASMKDAIATFDVDTMKGMSFAIVPVRSTDPDALAEDVKNVFGAEREGPMQGMVRFIGNKRLSAILVITSQKQYLARADAWIRKLDGRSRENEKQFFAYKVQNRPAKELVSVLNTMFASETGAAARGGAIAPRSQATTLASSTGAAPGSVAPAGGAATAPAASRNASPFGNLGAAAAPSPRPTSGAETGVQTAVLGEDARFRIAADETKNSLIIMATADDYKRILRVIERLDQLPNQVLIEATIAEVTLNDDMKFGVRWYLQQRASRGTFTNDIAGAVSSVFPGFSYVLRGANAQLTLNALSSVTNVNVISSPSLTVLDNKTATLQVGDQVPITTQSAVSVLGAGAPLVNSVTYRDTGVILSITPHINESGRVLLDIEQEVSSVAQTTTSNIDSPTIQQRKVRTSVVLNDSEALALGGLQQSKRTNSRDQIPGLGDIPVLGAAFRSKGDNAAKTELIILITPRVIRSLGEAAEATEEFKRKLFEIAPRSRLSAPSFERTARRIFN